MPWICSANFRLGETHTIAQYSGDGNILVTVLVLARAPSLSRADDRHRASDGLFFVEKPSGHPLQPDRSQTPVQVGARIDTDAAGTRNDVRRYGMAVNDY